MSLSVLVSFEKNEMSTYLILFWALFHFNFNRGQGRKKWKKGMTWNMVPHVL